MNREIKCGKAMSAALTQRSHFLLVLHFVGVAGALPMKFAFGCDDFEWGFANFEDCCVPLSPSHPDFQGADRRPRILFPPLLNGGSMKGVLVKKNPAPCIRKQKGEEAGEEKETEDRKKEKKNKKKDQIKDQKKDQERYRKKAKILKSTAVVLERSNDSQPSSLIFSPDARCGCSCDCSCDCDCNDGNNNWESCYMEVIPFSFSDLLRLLKSRGEEEERGREWELEWKREREQKRWWPRKAIKEEIFREIKTSGVNLQYWYWQMTLSEELREQIYGEEAGVKAVQHTAPIGDGRGWKEKRKGKGKEKNKNNKKIEGRGQRVISPEQLFWAAGCPRLHKRFLVLRNLGLGKGRGATGTMNKEDEDRVLKEACSEEAKLGEFSKYKFKAWWLLWHKAQDLKDLILRARDVIEAVSDGMPWIAEKLLQHGTEQGTVCKESFDQLACLKVPIYKFLESHHLEPNVLKFAELERSLRRPVQEFEDWMQQPLEKVLGRSTLQTFSKAWKGSQPKIIKQQLPELKFPDLCLSPNKWLSLSPKKWQDVYEKVWEEVVVYLAESRGIQFLTPVSGRVYQSPKDLPLPNALAEEIHRVWTVLRQLSSVLLPCAGGKGRLRHRLAIHLVVDAINFWILMTQMYQMEEGGDPIFLTLNKCDLLVQLALSKIPRFHSGESCSFEQVLLSEFQNLHPHAVKMARILCCGEKGELHTFPALPQLHLWQSRSFLLPLPLT